MDDQLQYIQHIQRGDKAAFAWLVQRYQKPLFAYLGRMGLLQSIAEEIAQETFLRVWQSSPRFDPTQSAFSTWIFTIARRLAINELSRAQHRYEQANHNDQNLLSQSTTVGMPDSNTTPEDHIQQAQQQQRLWQALQHLTVEDRSLLALAYLNEHDFSTIAHIEHIPVGTVKSRLYRIRQQLKTHLSQEEL